MFPRFTRGNADYGKALNRFFTLRRRAKDKGRHAHISDAESGLLHRCCLLAFRTRHRFTILLRPSFVLRLVSNFLDASFNVFLVSPRHEQLLRNFLLQQGATVVFPIGGIIALRTEEWLPAHVVRFAPAPSSNSAGISAYFCTERNVIEVILLWRDAIGILVTHDHEH
jgi:hypothetical protein